MRLQSRRTCWTRRVSRAFLKSDRKHLSSVIPIQLFDYEDEARLAVVHSNLIFETQENRRSRELPFRGSFRLLHALPEVEGRY